MKRFLLFLFAIVVVTAAASREDKLDHVILKEIIHGASDLKGRLKAEIFVQKVITTEHCTRMNFCKAGEVLSEYKAEELGLREKDWLLPRELVAYTRNFSCKDPTTPERIKLQQLVENVHMCAQKMYSELNLRP